MDNSSGALQCTAINMVNQTHSVKGRSSSASSLTYGIVRAQDLQALQTQNANHRMLVLDRRLNAQDQLHPPCSVFPTDLPNARRSGDPPLRILPLFRLPTRTILQVDSSTRGFWGGFGKGHVGHQNGLEVREWTVEIRPQLGQEAQSDGSQREL